MPSITSNLTSETRKPKLYFVNRFYAPDSSATSQILTDIAEALCQRGWQVTVFASRITYEGEKICLRRERISGVDVRRVWTSRLGRGTTVGRSIDYITFYFSVVLAALFTVSKGDVIIAKTDPPMLSIPFGLVSRFKRAKLVNWLQDVFPEVALNLGYGRKNGVLIKALVRLRNRSLRRAKMNVAIGSRMADKMIGADVNTNRVTTISNFVDDRAIRRSTTFSTSLRANWGFEQQDFVVGYSGNLGRAHDLDTILNVAENLRHAGNIKFLFVGGGYLHEKLEQEIRSRSLSSIVMKPYQSRDRLNESLALPNLHWASLAPELEGYIVPSKVYGIAAAGRPLLMIGSPRGEIGHIVSKFGFGICVQPGDIEMAEHFILRASRDPQVTRTMGERAREYIEQHASREQAISRWDEVITQITKTN